MPEKEKQSLILDVIKQQGETPGSMEISEREGRGPVEEGEREARGGIGRGWREHKEGVEGGEGRAEKLPCFSLAEKQRHKNKETNTEESEGHFPSYTTAFRAAFINLMIINSSTQNVKGQT